MKNSCKNCKFWKNHQRDLNYHENIGFCTNALMRFNTDRGRAVGVVDTENMRDRSKITGNPSHDFETEATKSRYILQTDDLFCCNMIELK